MQLMWFRNDLRALDNLALQESLSRDNATCALYIHCNIQMDKHDVGQNRQFFHLQQVKCLFQELQAVRIPCIYVEIDNFSDVPTFLRDFTQQYSIKSIWFNREYGFWELERDESLRLLMAERGVEVHTFDDGVILPARAVAQKSGQPYKVFTAFKHKWLSVIEETHLPSFGHLPFGSKTLPMLEQGLALLDARIDTLSQQVTRSVVEAWPVKKGAAKERLEQFFLTSLSQYDQDRNEPSIQGTSQISPYLASGVLSARQIYQMAQHAKLTQGQQTWVNELIWRDFYRHIMVHFPHVSCGQPFNRDYSRFEWHHNQEHLEAWTLGQTGVPLVDAGMRQLLKTGWMHNRVRMIVAMYLSKNLLLDWRCGERYFMQHLVDGDFASNNGGWQWSASVGTDAAPYFRIFNPLTQSERFDTQAQYIKQYVPELKSAEVKWILKADKYQKELVKIGYSPLIVDIKQTRLRAIEAFKRFKAK